MQYRQLGSSGPQVSLIGYGGWKLGQTGWGHVDPVRAKKTLEQCPEYGITLYDTAPVYGFGRSEKIIGEVLYSRRKDIILATKCGLSWNDRGAVFHDLSRDAVLRGIEESLKRLRTDYIDIFQIHWPDPERTIEPALETLNQLRADGVIRHIGISNFSRTQAQLALGSSPVVSIQTRYNLLQREAEADMLPFCRENNIGLLCYSPLAQGMLTGSVTKPFTPGRKDIRRFNPLYADRALFKKSLDYVKRLDGHPAEQALRFLARRTEVSSILVSVTDPRHLKQNVSVIDAQ